MQQVREAYSAELQSQEEAAAAAHKEAKEATAALADEQLRCKSLTAELSFSQGRATTAADSHLSSEMEARLRQLTMELKSAQHQTAHERKGADESAARARNAESKLADLQAETKRVRASERKGSDDELGKARERSNRLSTDLEREKKRRETAEEEVIKLNRTVTELQEQLRQLQLELAGHR